MELKGLQFVADGSGATNEIKRIGTESERSDKKVTGLQQALKTVGPGNGLKEAATLLSEVSVRTNTAEGAQRALSTSLKEAADSFLDEARAIEKSATEAEAYNTLKKAGADLTATETKEILANARALDQAKIKTERLRAVNRESLQGMKEELRLLRLEQKYRDLGNRERQETINLLRAEIPLTSRLARERLSLAKAIDKEKRSLDEGKKSSKGFGESFSSLVGAAGITLSLAVAIGALVSGLKAVIAAWSEYSRKLSGLSAITGAIGKDLKFLSDAARQMGATTQFSAVQAVEAFQLVASGKPELLAAKTALVGVTETVLVLASAAGTTLPKAADILTNALNQFQVGASEASRFMNTFAASSKFGSSLVEQTGEALKNAGTTAKLAGLSFEETLAAIQALAKTGIRGAEAGTALNQALLRLSNDNDSKVRPSIHGLVGAIKNLAAQNLSLPDYSARFGDEAARAVASLVSQLKSLEQVQRDITNTEIGFEQAAIQVNNLKGDIDSLKSAWEEFKISLGEQNDGAFRWITQGFTAIVREINEGAIGRLYNPIGFHNKQVLEGIEKTKNFWKEVEAQTKKSMKEISENLTALQKLPVPNDGIVKNFTSSLKVLEEVFERLKKTGNTSSEIWTQYAGSLENLNKMIQEASTLYLTAGKSSDQYTKSQKEFKKELEKQIKVQEVVLKNQNLDIKAKERLVALAKLGPIADGPEAELSKLLALKDLNEIKIKQLTDLEAKREKQVALIAKLNESLDEYTNIQTLESLGYESGSESLKIRNALLKEEISLVGENTDELNKYVEALLLSAERIDRLNTLKKNALEIDKLQAKALQENARAQEELTKNRDASITTFATELDKWREMKATLGLNEEELALYNAEKLKSATFSDAMVLKLQKEIIAYFNLKKEIEDNEKALTKWDETRKEIQGFASDFFSDIFAGSDDALDNFIDNFQKKFSKVFADILSGKGFEKGSLGDGFIDKFADWLGNSQFGQGTSQNFGAGARAGLAGYFASVSTVNRLGYEKGSSQAGVAGAISGGLAGYQATGSPYGALVGAVIGVLPHIMGSNWSEIGRRIGVEITEGAIVATTDTSQQRRQRGLFRGSDRQDITTDLNADQAAKIQRTYDSVRDAIIRNIELLGLDTSEIDNYIKNLQIDISGMNSEEQEYAIATAFQALADEMATYITPFAKIFDVAGERMAVTLAKLVDSFQLTRDGLEILGHDLESMISDEFLAGVEQEMLTLMASPLTQELYGMAKDKFNLQDLLAGDIEELRPGANIERFNEILDEIENLSVTYEEAMEIAVRVYSQTLAEVVGGNDRLNQMLTTFATTFRETETFILGSLQAQQTSVSYDLEKLFGELGVTRENFLEAFDNLEAVDPETLGSYLEAGELLANLMQIERDLAQARGEALDITSLTVDQINALQETVDSFNVTMEAMALGFDLTVESALEYQARFGTLEAFHERLGYVIETFFSDEEKKLASLAHANATVTGLNLEGFDLERLSQEGARQYFAGLITASQDDLDRLEQLFEASPWVDVIISHYEGLAAASEQTAEIMNQILGVTDPVNAGLKEFAAGLENIAEVQEGLSFILDKFGEDAANAELSLAQAGNQIQEAGLSLNQFQGEDARANFFAMVQSAILSQNTELINKYIAIAGAVDEYITAQEAAKQRTRETAHLLNQLTGSAGDANNAFAALLTTLDENVAQGLGFILDNFASDVDRALLEISSSSQAITGAGLDVSIFAGENARQIFLEMVRSAIAAGNEELVTLYTQIAPAVNQYINAQETLEGSLDNTGQASAEAAQRLQSLSQAIANAGNKIQGTINTLLSAGNAAFASGASPVLFGEIERLTGSLGAGSIEDQILNIENLTDMIGDYYGSQITAVQQLAQEAQQAQDQIRQEQDQTFQEHLQAYEALQQHIESLESFLLSLRIGGQGTAAPEQQMELARLEYERLLTSVLSGNADDSSALQSAASQYLSIAQSIFASSTQYASIFDSVTSGIQSAIDSIRATEPPERVHLPRISAGIHNLVDVEGKIADIQQQALEKLRPLQEELKRLQAQAEEEAKLAAERELQEHEWAGQTITLQTSQLVELANQSEYLRQLLEKLGLLNPLPDKGTAGPDGRVSGPVGTDLPELRGGNPWIIMTQQVASMEDRVVNSLDELVLIHGGILPALANDVEIIPGELGRIMDVLEESGESTQGTIWAVGDEVIKALEVIDFEPLTEEVRETNRQLAQMRQELDRMREDLVQAITENTEAVHENTNVTETGNDAMVESLDVGGPNVPA